MACANDQTVGTLDGRAKSPACRLVRGGTGAAVDNESRFYKTVRVRASTVFFDRSGPGKNLRRFRPPMPHAELKWNNVSRPFARYKELFHAVERSRNSSTAALNAWGASWFGRC